MLPLSLVLPGGKKDRRSKDKFFFEKYVLKQKLNVSPMFFLSVLGNCMHVQEARHVPEYVGTLCTVYTLEIF